MAPAKTDDDPVNPRPRHEPGVGARGRGRLGPAVEACFTVKGVEYVEVAKLTPTKASALKVAIPGTRTPRIVEQHILRNWGPAVYAISSIYP